jgi:hypothetical protein
MIQIKGTFSSIFFIPGVIFLAFSMVLAADVTNPAEVTGLMVTRDSNDLVLTWDPCTADAAGYPETIDHYDIFRGESPDFVPDKAGHTNRIGSSAMEDYRDTEAASDGTDYYYLVSAVDMAGNEGLTKDSTVTTCPVLSGYWTDTTIELSWTDALPVDQVTGYRVYYGKASGLYEFVDDVGLVNNHSLTGLETNVNWYSTVTAIDVNGNECDFSNEHVDPVGGTIDIRAHDEAELCWGVSKCPPDDPDAIQRSDGFQYLLPVDFPEGDWIRVDVTFTMASRLCDDPIAPDKCGDQNPGWNPCGDPWDRTAHLFLVLDDCVEGSGSCMTNDNIELMRAITPFGTDAPPPDGSGVVPPRALTLDITPFTPLLTGTKYVGAHIGHYTPKGWWVTVDFHFSKRSEEISPDPPADGFDPVFFHSSGSGLTGPFPVTVPLEAKKVIGRLFITGHGGNDDPVCGQPADEFCPRSNRILVNTSIAWEDTPWRDCCYPRGTEPLCLGCSDWNACGWPSCTYDRSGWCPGEIACHYNLDQGCDQDLDLTLSLAPGGSYNVEYEILDINGSWSRSLVAYWYYEIIVVCGDGVREGNELCDGSDLGGETCQSQGFDGGTLACNENCDGFDTSGCTDCGDGVKEGDEVCDGDDLGGETCQSQGFDGGTLACSVNCDSFDTSDCHVCGNHICELAGGEDCISCATDCNGEQSGNPGNRYCCGDGEGQNPVDCSDPRCTANGNTCEP